MHIIAHIYTDFSEKFGIPRQSNLIGELTGKIVFEKEYRNPDAFRGLEGFSYLWLLWQFQETDKKCAATVKPPRLGGNKRMGVFATRSPFRPNGIGLSSVGLERIVYTKEEGPVLYVKGADLMSGTPIYDIKPYLPYTDSHPDAKAGFSEAGLGHRLFVDFPKELLDKIPKDKQKALIHVLEQDPRPAYHKDMEKRYGVAFAGLDVRFYVEKEVLHVCGVVPLLPKDRGETEWVSRMGI